MEKEESSTQYDYLKDLVENSHHSNLKLIAAWDGFSQEEKTWFLRPYTLHPFPDKLLEKIYQHDNDYICYQAIMSDSYNLSERTKKFIEDHKNPLIKYINVAVSNSPEEYFNEPREKQLAMIANGENGLIDGEKLRDFILYGIENAKITEDEIFEMVKQYVRRYLSLSSGCFLERGDCKILWDLTTKLPSSSASMICYNMPVEDEDDIYGVYLSEEVLSKLDQKLLVILFKREDVILSEKRKKIFFSTTEENRELLTAISAHHLDFTHEEFGLLIKAKSKKLRILQYSTGVRLLYSDAAGYLADKLNLPNDNSRSEYPFDAFPHRIKVDKTEYFRKDNELLEYLIFNLTCIKLSNGYYYAGDKEFEFLSKHIVEGDIWATFINFFKELHGTKLSKKLLERHNYSEYGIAPLLDEDLFNLRNIHNNEKNIKNLTQIKLDHIWKVLENFKERFDGIQDRWMESKREFNQFVWSVLICALVYGGYKIFSALFS